MSTDIALVSVIIPSHNRSAILRQTLNALAQQTYPADQFEVVVVLDGCTDGSMAMLGEYSAPFTLQVIEQDQAGAARARNQGAFEAKGDLIIFIDDDIEACPGLIQAHVAAHLLSDTLVGIGYLPPNALKETKYFILKVKSWWEAKFHTMQQPGVRFCYTDLLSGNFSIRREIFERLGGFNSDFLVHEDYELGARLIEAGLDFTFLEAAAGLHHEQPDLNRSFQRKFKEAIYEIHLGQMYPQLIPTLLIWRLVHKSRLSGRVLRYLIFNFSPLAHWIALIISSVLPIFEKTRMLAIWRWFYLGLLGYWYWKGVAHELPTWKTVKDFLATRPANTQSQAKPEMVLDLIQGLEHAEQTLDRLRPASVGIYHQGQYIGYMPSEPGAERWRGAHLRPYLIDHCLFHLVEAYAAQGIIDLALSPDEIAALVQKGTQDQASRGYVHE